MANWERKSQYLLREIVKFRTYIDTLTTAQIAKQKLYAEREARGEEVSESAGDAVQDQKLMGEDGAKEAQNASEPLSTSPAPPPAFLLHP